MKTAFGDLDSEWWEFTSGTTKAEWAIQSALRSLTNRALRLNSYDNSRWVADGQLEEFERMTKSFTTRGPSGQLTIHRNTIFSSVPSVLRTLDPSTLIRAELGEACKLLSDRKHERSSRLNKLEADYDYLIGRMRRCRNAAAHGWPIDKIVAEIAAEFAAQVARIAAQTFISAAIRGVDPTSSDLAVQREQSIQDLDRLRNGILPWT